MSARAAARYAAVWRWHFYAGLFSLPFVVWLAITGAIYLWRPQIEGWLDRRYDTLSAIGAVAPPEAQVAAALRAVPGGRLHRYVMPSTSHSAVRVLVERDGIDWRVYVDPRRLTVLGVAVEERRPMRLVFHLHGELMAGAIGSWLVEIAACWTVVMLVTGLYLWWPRGRRGMAGVLYPSFHRGGRRFWRDLHASAGLWVSAAALALVLTGLPWAAGWGGYLAEIRRVTGTARGPVDWTIGGKAPAAAMAGDHAGHGGGTMATMPATPPPAGELNRVVAAARPLGLAAPVLVSPPRHSGGAWTVASDDADRPHRGEATVDGASGRVLTRTGFADRHWIDRGIGYGIAAHEGQLFGLANQLLGTLVALLLVMLSVSGAVMWWRRRPAGAVGAPMPRGRARFGPAVAAAIVALALYLPMFGLTLIAVLAAEAAVRRWRPRMAAWLGLAPHPA